MLQVFFGPFVHYTQETRNCLIFRQKNESKNTFALNVYKLFFSVK